MNVTTKFYLAIRFGFWLAIINFSREIIRQLSIYLNSEKFVYANYVIWSVWVCLALIWFTFTNMWRFSSYGRVCSGDYLDVKNPKAKDYEEYLIVEGEFLYAVLIAIYTIFGIALVMVCVTAIVLAKKVPAD